MNNSYVWWAMTGMSKACDQINMQLKRKLCSLRAVSIGRAEGVCMVGDLALSTALGIPSLFLCTDFRYSLSQKAMEKPILRLACSQRQGRSLGDGA